MSKREFRLPDGNYILVPEDATFAEADSWARQNFPDSYKGFEEPSKKKEGFFANVKEGARNLIESSGVGIGAAMSPEQARALAERANARESDVKTVSWQDVKDAQGAGDTLGTFGAFARDTLGQAFPQIGATLAGAGAGGAAGSLAGPVGAAIGAGIGGIAANLPAAFGGNIQRQVQEAPGQDPNLAAAGAAAAGMSALDALPVLGLLGRMGVSKVAGEGIQQLLKQTPAEVEAKLLKSAQQSLLAATGKGAAIGAAVEMPAEVAQAVLERAQAGLPLTSPDALQEYEANAAGALVVGAPLGAAGRVSERSQGKDVQRTKEVEARQLEAQENLKKQQAEEARKRTPQYLLTDLEPRYNQYLSTKQSLEAELKAIGKVEKGTAEEAQKRALVTQLRELTQGNKELVEEYGSRKKAIDAAKEKARVDGMTPLQYQMEQMGVDLSERPTEQRVFTGEEEFTAPDPLVEELNRQVEGLRFAADMYGQDIDPTDVAERLLQNPELAQQVLDSRPAIPGLDAKGNSAVREIIKLQLRDREKLAGEMAKGREKAAKERTKEDVAEADLQRATREAEEILSLLATKPAQATTTAAAEPGTAPILDEAQRAQLEAAKQAYDAKLAEYNAARAANAPTAAQLRNEVIAARENLDEVTGTVRSAIPQIAETLGGAEAADRTPEAPDARFRELSTVEAELKEQDDLLKSYANKTLEKNGVVTEDGRRAALVQTRRDALVAERQQLLQDIERQSQRTLTRRPEISIESLIDEALTPVAGEEVTGTQQEIEQRVEKLSKIRAGLVDKYAALASERQGRDIPGLNERLKDSKAELIAAIVAEIKAARSYAGLSPLTTPDAVLAKQVEKKIDDDFVAGQRRKGEDEPRTTAKQSGDDPQVRGLEERIAKTQAEIEDLEARQEVGEPVIIPMQRAERELSRLQQEYRSLRLRTDPYFRRDQENRSVIDRQLNFITDRLRELGVEFYNGRMRPTATTPEQAAKRVIGAQSAYPRNAEERQGEIDRLLAARTNLMRRRNIGFGGAELSGVAQNVVDYYVTSAGQRQRPGKLTPKPGTARRVSGQEGFTLGRQFPQQQPEERISPEDQALVQRMREEEIARINDAVTEGRVTGENAERADRAIQQLLDRIDAPVTQQDVARAQEMFGPQRDTETPDLFREGLDQAMIAATQQEGAVAAETKAAKSEMGRALGGMKGKSSIKDAADRLAAKFGKTPTGDGGEYAKAKARLDEARAKVQELNKRLEEATKDAQGTRSAKLGAVEAEAQAERRAQQRTLSVIQQRLKAAQQKTETPPAIKPIYKQFTDRIVALRRKIDEELRPLLKGKQEFMAVLRDGLIARREGVEGAASTKPYSEYLDEKMKSAGARARLLSSGDKNVIEKQYSLLASELLRLVKSVQKVSPEAAAQLRKNIGDSESPRLISTSLMKALLDADNAIASSLFYETELAAKYEAGTEKSMGQFAQIAKEQAARKKRVADLIASAVAESRKRSATKEVQALTQQNATEAFDLLQQYDNFEQHVEELGALLKQTEKEAAPIEKAISEGQKEIAAIQEEMKNAGLVIGPINASLRAKGYASEGVMPAIMKVEQTARRMAELETAADEEADAPDTAASMAKFKQILADLKETKAEHKTATKELAAALEKQGRNLSEGITARAQKVLDSANERQKKSDERYEQSQAALRARTGAGLPGIRRVAGKTQEILSDEQQRKAEEAERAEQRTRLQEEVEGKADRLAAEVARTTGAVEALEKAAKVNDNDAVQAELREARRAARAAYQAQQEFQGERRRPTGPATERQSPPQMRTGVTEANEPTKKLESQAKKRQVATRKARLDVAEALLSERNQDTDYEDTGIDVGGRDVFFSGGDNEMAPITAGMARQAKNHPVNGKSFEEAADWLVGQIKDPIKKMFAARVAQALRGAKGTVEFSAEYDEPGAGYGAYNNDIFISPRVFNPKANLEYVLLHELTHAATYNGLIADPELSAKVMGLVKRVKAWTETPAGKKYLQDNPGVLEGKRVYGLDNVVEFTAETFSNADFQKLLSQVPAEQKQTGLSRFVQLIAKLFRAVTGRELNTLTEAIKLTEDAMLQNWLVENSQGVPEGTRFYAPKREYASSELGDAAKTMIGERTGTLAAIRNEATGLGFRTRFIDSNAALKAALDKGDATAAIQVSYDLMTFAQRNHFVQQAISTGAPTRTKWEMVNGKQTFKTEAQEGPNLKRVAELLSQVKGFGNAQATSDAFTLLALGLRARTRGWDTVFGDAETDSPAKKEEKAKARAEADKLADQYLADKANSPFAAAYKEYQDFNKSMFKFAMEAGVITEGEYRDALREGNYTPLFRKDKNDNLVLKLDSGRDITVGRLGDEAHLNKLKGGDTQVFDFFTASVRNASVLIDASLHNIASREAAFALQAMGAARKLGNKEKSKNAIEFRVKGREDLQRFEIDTDAFGIPTELVAKGFAGVPASLPNVVRLLGAPATFLRKAITRNPLYMARQLVRDPMSAWLTTGANFAPVSDTFKELGTALKGTDDKTLERRGLTGGMLFAEDDTDIERIAQTAGKMPGWSVGYVAAKLDDMSLATDAITRRNVYNAAIQQGASEIEATMAAYEAMPFSKRGTSPSLRYANHMVPFLSATVQGWDVLYRAAKGDMPLNERVDVRNKLLARGAMIAGITMLYALAMEDDEVYKNANTSERLSNWFLRVPGTEQTIKVPIPFELGIIFKMIPEALVRGAAEDKELSKELMNVGEATLGMIPNFIIPQAVIPIVETTLNKSFFTGNPIEGKQLESVDIGERYDKSTSQLSKLLGFDVDVFGTQMGISPKKLEYMASQYTAGLYPAFAAIIDTILPAPSAEKPDRKLAELPVFRSALQQEDAGGQVNRLYDRIERLTKYDATFKKLLKEDPAKAQVYAQENAEQIGKGAVARKAQAAIDKFNEMENIIRNNQSMNSAQKQKALENVKRLKTNLASQFSEILRT